MHKRSETLAVSQGLPVKCCKVWPYSDSLAASHSDMAEVVLGAAQGTFKR